MRYWLVGDGLLHTTITRRLAGRSGLHVAGRLDDLPSDPADVVILAQDVADTSAELRVQQKVRAQGLTMLPARIDGDLGMVGPWVRPDGDRCVRCSERARHRVVLGEHDLDLDDVPPVLPVTAPHLAETVASTVAAALDDPELLGDDGVYAVRARDLSGQVHRFHPVVGCVECDTLPMDSPEGARVELRPAPQEDPEQFRVRPAGLETGTLRSLAYDWRYGPIKQVFRDERSPLALVAARVVPIGGSVRESGYGRSTTYTASEVIALYEALERIATATPTGRRTIVRGSAHSLDGRAIDVPSLGLHDPRWYAHPHFEPVPWSPDVETDWVWAWRLRADEPVLVPEHVAYYDIDLRGRAAPSPRFLYESSSGCAIGSTLEEAILYGLFEIIERDAFLMAWYGKLAVPRLELPDEGVLAVARQQLDALGYDLILHDLTNDLAVPAVGSLAVRRDDRGPKAFFAAGAHCDPRRAVHNAVAEVVTNVVLYPRREERDPDEHDLHRLASLLDRDEDVVSLEDHIALYTLPQAVDRYTHLLEGTTARSVKDAFGDWRERWVRPDLRDTLRAVLDALGERDLDPVVVDETPAGLGRHGLHAVKVLLPGALPMTFGGVHRRLHGLQRLSRVPHELGYWPAPRSLDELTLDVHPFP